MWKAIIIDDEKLIREGLATYIPWAELHVEICATCRNGVEGMDAILQHHPDFVLTDISMPDMDGITLLKQVRLHGIPCEFIFISSYSDFNYAKNAVTYGAFDYLLKPIEASSLESCVRRLIKKLSDQKTQPPPLVNFEAIQKMFLHLLSAMPQSEPAFQGMLQYDGIHRTDTAWFLLLDGQGADAVRTFAQSVPAPPKSFDAGITASIHAFLFCFDGDSAHFLAQLQGALEKGNCRFYFSSCKEGIVSAFEHAQHALLSARYPVPAAANQSDFLQDFALTPSVIRQADSRAIFLAMAFLWQNLRKETKEEIPLNSRFVLFLEKCYGQLEEYYGAPLVGCEEKYHYLRRLRSGACLYERFILLHTLVEELLRQCRTQAAGSPYTRRAVKVIHNRYHENLSLQQVAQEIGVSKSHLSSVFKADTGSSFSDYLFLHRMHIAQSLLKQHKYKIYEVGSMVGYPDVVQFSKRFKKHFQISPKQWQSEQRGPE